MGHLTCNFQGISELLFCRCHYFISVIWPDLRYFQPFLVKLVYFCKKIPKKGWKWPNSGWFEKIFKLHLQHNNFDISWKIQVKRTIISKNILRKEKNKSKIEEFPYPGVTFLTGQKIFCGTKLQMWHNVSAKWFPFLSYIKK